MIQAREWFGELEGSGRRSERGRGRREGGREKVGFV